MGPSVKWPLDYNNDLLHLVQREASAAMYPTHCNFLRYLLIQMYFVHYPLSTKKHSTLTVFMDSATASNLFSSYLQFSSLHYYSVVRIKTTWRKLTKFTHASLFQNLNIKQ